MLNLLIGGVIGVSVVLLVVYRDKVKVGFVKVKAFFKKVTDKIKRR